MTELEPNTELWCWDILFRDKDEVLWTTGEDFDHSHLCEDSGDWGPEYGRLFKKMSNEDINELIEKLQEMKS